MKWKFGYGLGRSKEGIPGGRGVLFALVRSVFARWGGRFFCSGLFLSLLCAFFLLNVLDKERAFGQGSEAPPAAGVPVQGATAAPAPAEDKAPQAAAQAAPQAAAVSSSESPASDKAARAYSFGASAEYYSNLYKESTYEREAGLSLGADASYNFSEVLTLATSVSINKDLQGAGDTELYDVPVYLRYREYQGKLSDGVSLSLSGRLIGILPTDRLSREDYTFYGAIGVRQDVSLRLDDLKVPISMVLAGSAVRNFHEYDMGYNGRYNVQHILRGAFTLGFQFLESLGLSISTTYSNRVGYNSAGSDSFSTDGVLDYGFNKMVSISAGVSNQGDMLQSDGHSSNFSYFRESSSRLHAGVGIKF